MSQHGKVITGMQTLARHCKEELRVVVAQDQQGTWIIQFQAGELAAVRCTLQTFVAAPSIVLEPFTEELIKGMR